MAADIPVRARIANRFHHFVLRWAETPFRRSRKPCEETAIVIAVPQ